MFKPHQVLSSLRHGQELPAEELRHFVLAVGADQIPDYQIAAFCMAVCCQQLSCEGVHTLTTAMRDSGRVLDWRDLPGPVVDKHSTGGVGDKVSLILAPLLAACGCYVPMISGRGLGHTGGTLDKLESIEGFCVSLGIERLQAQVREVRCAIVAADAALAPADARLYAIRDVTATVDSQALMTASILSKKLAEGIDALIMDIKVGSGAFLLSREAARGLGALMVHVGEQAGLTVRAVVSEMSQPLGRAIGNALEVQEAIDVLQGRGPADTWQLTQTLGRHLLQVSGLATDAGQAESLLQAKIDSGHAYACFERLVHAQGGAP